MDYNVSMSTPIKVRLGYACINLSTGLRCNSTCRLKTLENLQDSKSRLNHLIGLANKNLLGLDQILDWNYRNDITLYRLTCDLFPHISNPQLKNLLDPIDHQHYWEFQPFIDKLKKIAEKAIKYQIRLSFHPGQYNNLGSPNPTVVKNTFTDLTWPANFFDLLEKLVNIKDAFKNSVIVIHGGGLYGNKELSLLRWESNFKLLPKNLAQRLVLENDEKCYSPSDLLPICNRNQIPLVFDFHHYNCYQIYHSDQEPEDLSKILPLILKTWHIRGLTPKFHVSEQDPTKQCGAHSEWIQEIPQQLLDLQDQNLFDFDIMLECKKKDLVVLLLYHKYNGRYTQFKDKIKILPKIKIQIKLKSQ